ncbi:MAG TPA: hypothetical protein PKK23_04065 [Nitrospirales bacterium]|nr:hypothetical protein [Nitrospirales bacterium]
MPPLVRTRRLQVRTSRLNTGSACGTRDSRIDSPHDATSVLGIPDFDRTGHSLHSL